MYVCSKIRSLLECAWQLRAHITLVLMYQPPVMYVYQQAYVDVECVSGSNSHPSQGSSLKAHKNFQGVHLRSTVKVDVYVHTYVQ